MSVRDAYLPILDLYRGALNTMWDLRRFDVLVRVNQWEGPLPGHGVTTTTDTALLVNGARPKVEQLASKEVIASGGRYHDQDLRIGPLTPPYPNAQGLPAGVSIDVFDPAYQGPNVEVLFRVTGPGTDAAGDWYRALNLDDVPGNFRYCVVLRKTGATDA